MCFFSALISRQGPLLSDRQDHPILNDKINSNVNPAENIAQFPMRITTSVTTS